MTLKRLDVFIHAYQYCSYIIIITIINSTLWSTRFHPYNTWIIEKEEKWKETRRRVQIFDRLLRLCYNDNNNNTKDKFLHYSTYIYVHHIYMYHLLCNYYYYFFCQPTRFIFLLPEFFYPFSTCLCSKSIENLTSVF